MVKMFLCHVEDIMGAIAMRLIRTITVYLAS